MRRFLIAAITVALACGTLFAAHTPFEPSNMRQPRVNGRSLFTRPNTTTKPQRAASINPDHRFEATDGFTTLDGPDGTVWYAATNYHYTNDKLTGFTTTVYDNRFEFVGTVEDLNIKPDASKGETSIGDIQINPFLSTRFFNTSDDCEMMVFVIANTGAPYYLTNEYTLVYRIAGEGEEQSGPTKRIEGNCVQALNVSEYYEQFYFVFCETKNIIIDPATGEETTRPITDGNYQLDETFTFSTLKSANYSGENKAVHTWDIKSGHIGSDTALPYLIVPQPGSTIVHIFTSGYEKPFFLNPFDFADDTLTPDNNFVVTHYSYGWSLNEVSRTSIAAEPVDPETGVLYKMISLGNFRYFDDIIFDGANTRYVLTLEDYYSNDTSNYTYAVFNSAGEKTAVIAEGVSGGILTSDVAGCSPQALFVVIEEDLPAFRVVDLDTYETVGTIPLKLNDGVYSLNASYLDRVGEDLYACALGEGRDEDGVVFQDIVYFTSDGTVDHVDELNLGHDVAYAQVLMDARYFGKGIYTNDGSTGYAVLVKRNLNAGATATTEDFRVVTNTGRNALTAEADAETGDIWYINFEDDLNGKRMAIVWNKNWNFTTDYYNLPLEKFAGGDGSAENPWLISTVGDLQLMRQDLSAHYRLAADLDMSGETYSPVGTERSPFVGTFDGVGHVIENLSGSNPIFGVLGEGSVVKDLFIYNATFDKVGADENCATIALAAYGANISKIRVIGLTATNCASEATGGGLVAEAGASMDDEGVRTPTVISECHVSRASIDAEGLTFGGIVGAYANPTGLEIRACAVSGDFNVGEGAGGILGSMDTRDRVVDCHVTADIIAASNVGGIVGLSERGIIAHNHFSGSVTARELSYTGTPNVGGILGALNADYSEEPSTDVIVYNNIADVKSLDGPQPTGSQWEPIDEKFLNTIHRIVGFTSYNMGDQIDWESVDWDNYDPDNLPVIPAIVEACIANNHATGAPYDDTFDGTDHTSVEGRNVATVNAELFASLEFAAGETLETPWNHTTGALYFENTLTLAFTPAEYAAEIGEEVEMTLSILGDAEDINPEEISVEATQDGILEIVSTAVDGRFAFITVKALNAGTTMVNATIGNATASATVTVNGTGALDTLETTESTHEAYFDLTGRRILNPQPGTIVIERLSDGSVRKLRF